MNRVAALLEQIIAEPVPFILNVDGQKMATAMTNRINAMRYSRGAEVVL
jgi:hypothetical protein